MATAGTLEELRGRAESRASAHDSHQRQTSNPKKSLCLDIIMMSSSLLANQRGACRSVRSDVWEKVCGAAPSPLPPIDEQVLSSLVSTEITINKSVCHLAQPLNGWGVKGQGLRGMVTSA